MFAVHLSDFDLLKELDMGATATPIELSHAVHEPRADELTQTGIRRVLDVVGKGTPDGLEIAVDATHDAIMGGLGVGGEGGLSAASFEELRAEVAGRAVQIARTATMERARRREETVGDDVARLDGASTVPDPSAELEAVDQRALVQGMIDDLDPDQAAAVRMRYVEDRPSSEVAESLGVSERTVRRRVQGGIEMMRDMMGPRLRAMLLGE